MHSSLSGDKHAGLLQTASPARPQVSTSTQTRNPRHQPAQPTATPTATLTASMAPLARRLSTASAASPSNPSNQSGPSTSDNPSGPSSSSNPSQPTTPLLFTANSHYPQDSGQVSEEDLAPAVSLPPTRSESRASGVSENTRRRRGPAASELRNALALDKALAGVLQAGGGYGEDDDAAEGWRVRGSCRSALRGSMERCADGDRSATGAGCRTCSQVP